jgi:hypothetical protein
MPDYHLAFAEKSELADKIRRAIGARDYDQIVACIPELPSSSGANGARTPWFVPESGAAVDLLQELPRKVLRSMGMRYFDKFGGQELWLFPSAWREHLPDELKVVTITGDTGRLGDNRSTDQRYDQRFGTLSVGVLIDPSRTPIRGAPDLQGTLVAAAAENLDVGALIEQAGSALGMGLRQRAARERN